VQDMRLDFLSAMKSFAVGLCSSYIKGKGKVHPCTGAEALYKPYGL